MPVTDRGDAIGLIERDLPYHPDERAVADIAAAGHALAYIVVANRRHTDLFEWGQRSVVCLDSYGGPPRPRVSTAGANT